MTHVHLSARDGFRTHLSPNEERAATESNTQSGDCAYRLDPGVGAFARTRSGICATAVAGILKWVEMEKGLQVGAWRTATDTGPTNRAAEHNPVSSGLSTPPIAIGPIRTLSLGAKKMPHPLNGGEALG
jgi:hypothetical protein